MRWCTEPRRRSGSGNGLSVVDAGSVSAMLVSSPAQRSQNSRPARSLDRPRRSLHQGTSVHGVTSRNRVTSVPPAVAVGMRVARTAADPDLVVNPSGLIFRCMTVNRGSGHGLQMDARGHKTWDLFIQCVPDPSFDDGNLTGGNPLGGSVTWRGGRRWS